MTQCIENLPVYYVPEFYLGIGFGGGLFLLAFLGAVFVWGASK